MLIKINTLIIALSVITFLGCSKPASTPAPQPQPVVVVIVPPVTDTVIINTPVTPPTNYAGYQLVWNDEFNGVKVDTVKWNFETGTGINGDFGTGQLDRATARTDNIKIVNGVLNSGGGCLAITTKKENFQDRAYTSGRLNTIGKGAWGPGNRLEARIWPRDVLYKGQGFAFWMMPAEIPAGQTYLMWPQGGEIDIMEYVGSIPFNNLGSVHYAWFWNNNQYADWNHGHVGAYFSYADRQVPIANPGYGGYPVKATDASAGSNSFHIYGIDWYTDRMEFAIDHQVYHIHYFNDGAAFDNGVTDGKDQNSTQTIGGNRVLKSEYSNHFLEWTPFKHNFNILLTAGVGGKDDLTYGGSITPDAVFPCTTFIDWIRIYKRL